MTKKTFTNAIQELKGLQKSHENVAAVNAVLDSVSELLGWFENGGGHCGALHSDLGLLVAQELDGSISPDLEANLFSIDQFRAGLLKNHHHGHS